MDFAMALVAPDQPDQLIFQAFDPCLQGPGTMVTFARSQQYNAMMLLSSLPLVARRMFPKSDPVSRI
jgi:hypothetical protein